MYFFYKLSLYANINELKLNHLTNYAQPIYESWHHLLNIYLVKFGLFDSYAKHFGLFYDIRVYLDIQNMSGIQNSDILIGRLVYGDIRNGRYAKRPIYKTANFIFLIGVVRCRKPQIEVSYTGRPV